MADLVRRYGLPLTLVMTAATAIWLVLMVGVPALTMIEYSFHTNLPLTRRGGADDVYTLEHYAALFQGIDWATWTFPTDFQVFLRTIWGACLVTVVSLVACYPVAWHVAKVARRDRAALMVLLLVVPFWINEILRAFAWYVILAYRGPLNALLLEIGLIDSPVRWLSGSGGVLLGMTYAFLLFMVFPLINAMETLDDNLVDAARDLGAPRWQIHRKIVIPHAKPGIAVGCMMVFVLAASSYIVPALLGSPGTRWFTETIYIWFFEGQNWPRGTAYALILLMLCIGFILLMMRLFRVGLSDMAR